MQGSLFDGSVLTRPHTADYAGLLSLLGRVMITYIEYIMCGVYWGERERAFHSAHLLLSCTERESFSFQSPTFSNVTHMKTHGMDFQFFSREHHAHNVTHSVKQRTRNTQCLTHMFLVILLYNHDYTIAVVSSSEHHHLHSTFVVKVTWFSFFFCETTEVSPQSS